MMLLSIREWYMDRKKLINQSIDYIMKHLDENLSLDTVAAHFFISKYHFSRIFKEETGESVYAFIKRCKIDQSAIDMKLNPAKAITDIGLDYGYSASNYSSVFRQHHDTPHLCLGSQYPPAVCLFPFPQSGLSILKQRRNIPHKSKSRSRRICLCCMNVLLELMRTLKKTGISF